MRRIVLLAAVLALSVPVRAEQGTITIQTISADKEHVVVTFEHTPVVSSDQIHVFVDDRFEKAISGKNRIGLNLKPGNHTIDLRDTTKEHQIRGGCRRVQVTISDTETSRSLSPAGGEECKP